MIEINEPVGESIYFINSLGQAIRLDDPNLDHSSFTKRDKAIIRALFHFVLMDLNRDIVNPYLNG